MSLLLTSMYIFRIAKYLLVEGSSGVHVEEDLRASVAWRWPREKRVIHLTVGGSERLGRYGASDVELLKPRGHHG